VTGTRGLSSIAETAWKGQGWQHKSAPRAALPPASCDWYRRRTRRAGVWYPAEAAAPSATGQRGSARREL